MIQMKKFLKWLWELIKSFNTPKGLISLLISFILFCGWALVFILIGILFKNAWFFSIGSAVITFWSLPLTPMWPTIIAFAMFLRKFIFKDKKGD